ncbi:hypothetical protein PVAP13_2NG535600 [Panicum virgatum]|uniref:Uncharacterized protein n=1 Tax=Panicum virgatum TaxID=38727 RepID=A0A8T0VR85_PANVG|nr:hypothetical protein PVAP13_2NG535600 [Panicum virgatum]
MREPFSSSHGSQRHKASRREKRPRIEPAAAVKCGIGEVGAGAQLPRRAATTDSCLVGVASVRWRSLYVDVGVAEIYFLLLSGNGEKIEWLRSLHDGSDNGGEGIYSVGNLLGATAWRIRFPDGVIEAGMVPSS